MHLDIDNLSVIYITTEVDRERINQEPPQLPYEPDNPMAEQNLLDSVKTGAYQFDCYKNVVQCSIMWHNVYHHFMYCDDPSLPNRQVDGDWRHIHVVDYERDLICEFSKLVNEMFPCTVQGYPLGGGTIAGWRLTNDIWPLMVNKAFGSGCILPKSVMTNPMKRYTTTECLLDISTIYTQGAAPATRRLPSLADTLTYWGFTDINFATPGEIRAGICRDPMLAASKVELYLLAMEGVVRQYCGYEMRGDLHPLVKDVVYGGIEDGKNG